MDLDRLGMGEHDRERFERAIHEPYGAVLVTGPTGSGKSTSLYAALGVLNTPEKNIITIEDPVEYQLEGITQVQVNPRAGLGFATGLRAMMRADPDIIMVGEIRDRRDGADRRRVGAHRPSRALHAAHERRGDGDHAPGRDGGRAVPRRELDRLRRRPAPRPHAVPALQAARDHPRRDAARQRLPRPGSTSRRYEPVGCGRCNGTGYKGRLGLYEVMVMTEEIRGLAIERAPADKIVEVAVRDGMRRLREDGLHKVMLGRTSLAEVARVTGTT